MTYEAPAGPDHATDDDWLAEQFEAQRSRLRAVATRMLGDGAEAEDAVQEAWFRLQRTGSDTIDNLSGWLTTVVSRVCLDHLRSRTARREDAWAPVEEVAAEHRDTVAAEPEGAALEADAVGAALQVVLDTLTPAERLAFVLHDLFGVPFDQIAPIVERTPETTRQLASRARRRVRGTAFASGEPAVGPDGAEHVEAPALPADRARQREVVEAFLAASREGRFEDLLQVLDPDVVLRADPVAVEATARVVAQGLPAPVLAAEAHGAFAVATAFVGRALAARVALIDGEVGAAFVFQGQVRSAYSVRVRDGRVVALDVCGDPEALAAKDVVLLEAA
ncbi:RNA polymerase sigma factor [Luteimicrobium album]|uniref:RNA polymerase sigma factor n=1 Tax=Luteimicrobium album TaxID=1054550 RepID=A0ABQ6I2B5_9MICO|nr:sigma-70 family RNA polymerase sigma factor [Luteimicrobium album]GMA24406.1 RNA polymerase sigma factor [Luteimicrobium album]